MNLQKPSWQQIALLTVCLAAIGLAYKFLGPEAASAIGVGTTVLHMALTSSDTPSAPPGPSIMSQAVAMVFVVVLSATALVGCGSWFQDVDDAELQGVAVKLSKCRGEGREAGTYSAYEACKTREHIDATGYHPIDIHDAGAP